MGVIRPTASRSEADVSITASASLFAGYLSNVQPKQDSEAETLATLDMQAVRTPVLSVAKHGMTRWGRKSKDEDKQALEVALPHHHTTWGEGGSWQRERLHRTLQKVQPYGHLNVPGFIHSKKMIRAAAAAKSVRKSIIKPPFRLLRCPASARRPSSDRPSHPDRHMGREVGRLSLPAAGQPYR